MEHRNTFALMFLAVLAAGAAARSLQQDATSAPDQVQDNLAEPLARHKSHKRSSHTDRDDYTDSVHGNHRDDYSRDQDYRYEEPEQKRRYYRPDHDYKPDYQPDYSYYPHEPDFGVPPVQPPPVQPPPGPADTATDNNAIFLGPTKPDLCNIGPTFWCRPDDNNFNQRLCMLQNYTSVGVCGYASTPAGCPQTSIANFCASNPNALTFNGGINGAPTGYFGYYALAMTWVPSSCNSTTPFGGFCSSFNGPTSYSATHLVLHGLWPDFGSIYAQPGPQPPFYNGTQKSYQGWPQWCDGDGIFTSQCAVGPNNACPWANKTSINQTELERCLRAEGITQCLVPDSVTDALGGQFAQIAPGYLAPNGKPTTFMDHEYFKHGSCIGGYLAHNMTAYFDYAVRIAFQLNEPGTPADLFVSKNVGGKVKTSDLTWALKQQAIPTCKNNCDLDEVWYCMGRTASGLPTELIKCPVGTLASNSCLNKGCEYINIPAWK